MATFFLPTAGPVVIVVLVILFLVAVTAFFVAAEFSAVAVRTVRIQALAESGSASARRMLPFLKDAAALDRYVAACQIGITLSSLILGAYGQVHLHHFFSELLGNQAAALALVLILLTGFHVVLGELLPKAVALRYPERVVIALTYPMLFCLWLFGWAIRFLNGTGNLALKLLGVPVQGHRHVHSPEELVELVRRGTEAGSLEDEESLLLERAFHFGTRRAHECMTPRIKVVGLDLLQPVEVLLERAAASSYSRLPVYRGSLDHVEGYLHVKDLVGLSGLPERFNSILKLPSSVTVQQASNRCAPVALISFCCWTNMGERPDCSPWKTSSNNWWATSGTNLTLTSRPRARSATVGLPTATLPCAKSSN